MEHEWLEDTAILHIARPIPYGKYVIECDSRNRIGCRMYLQDRNIEDGYFWTGQLCKAYGFTSLERAVYRCQRLQYNNPRVMLVAIDGLQEVWRNDRRY